MDTELKAVGHYPRLFKEWGISVTFVRTEDNAVYVSVRQLCVELGIDGGKQIKKLEADPDFASGLAELPVPTAGGMQKMVCIRKREMAWWLINLNDSHCKPNVRGHIQEIKQTIIEAAEKLLFGDIDREPDSARGVIAVSSRNEIVFACLDCGAKHRIVILNGEPIVTLEREQ